MSIDLEAIKRNEAALSLGAYVPGLIAELEAARAARKELADLHADLDSHDLTAASAYRLSDILRAWDEGR
jgi:hypothetical protein